MKNQRQSRVILYKISSQWYKHSNRRILNFTRNIYRNRFLVGGYTVQMDMTWVPERNLIGMATRRLSVMSRAELAGERVGDEVADVDVDELLDLL